MRDLRSDPVALAARSGSHGGAESLPRLRVLLDDVIPPLDEVAVEARRADGAQGPTCTPLVAANPTLPPAELGEDTGP